MIAALEEMEKEGTCHAKIKLLIGYREFEGSMMEDNYGE